MRGVWLLAAGCAADPIPVPPIPDQTVQVVTADLGTDNFDLRAASVIFDAEGNPSNQLGMAFHYLQSAELYPTITMDVQLSFMNDVLTLLDHGVASTPKQLQEDRGVVVAGGWTAMISFDFGNDPVQVELTDATVRLDPATLNGAFGGIVPTAQKTETLLPAAVRALNVQVAKDCRSLDDPAAQCGCPQETNGHDILGIIGPSPFAHCVITVEDLEDGPYANVVLDDTPTGISIGMAITTEQR